MDVDPEHVACPVDDLVMCNRRLGEADYAGDNRPSNQVSQKTSILEKYIWRWDGMDLQTSDGKDAGEN